MSKRSYAGLSVFRAVKAGKLPSLKASHILCVDCGHRAVVYDHRDYSKPLDVEPVCQACNVLRGSASGWLPPSKTLIPLRIDEIEKARTAINALASEVHK